MQYVFRLVKKTEMEMIPQFLFLKHITEDLVESGTWEISKGDNKNSDRFYKNYVE